MIDPTWTPAKGYSHADGLLAKLKAHDALKAKGVNHGSDNREAHSEAESGKGSQRQIARPGTSYAYISRLEANKRQPSWKALAAIAERLGTTGLYLLTGKHDAVCPFCGRKDETKRDGD